MTEKENELLPCPFCGELPDRIEAEASEGDYYAEIRCTNQKCFVMPVVHANGDKEICRALAIKRWNTRYVGPSTTQNNMMGDTFKDIIFSEEDKTVCKTIMQCMAVAKADFISSLAATLSRYLRVDSSTLQKQLDTFSKELRKSYLTTMEKYPVIEKKLLVLAESYEEIIEEYAKDAREAAAARDWFECYTQFVEFRKRIAKNRINLSDADIISENQRLYTTMSNAYDEWYATKALNHL